MLLFQVALVLVALVVCCFAPGFFFVRKLRWSPLEKLCGSVALSVILLYLASWVIYCAKLPWGWTLVVIASMLFGFAWKDILRFVRIGSVRRTIYGFGFLLFFTMVMLGIIRHYSGGGWFGDWLEHFHRSLFFLHRLPEMTVLFPGYALPARPPLVNVLGAFFMGLTADRYELLQVVALFLNLLLFPACLLMMTALKRNGRRHTLLLVALFAAGPALMEQTTYLWTKASAAFFVLTALWFYLAGWRKNDSVRTTAAFVCLAAGLLVHYSAGPYVVVLAVHYLLVIFPKRLRWKELVAIGVLSAGLLATWFGWSFATYGSKITLESNSSITSSQQYKGSTAGKIVLNLWDTLVPAVIRQPAELANFDQPTRGGWWRDRFFTVYQLNLLFTMGLVGGPLVLWFVWRELKRKGRETRFWSAAIPCIIVVGIGVVGERDQIGVPHLTLLPLTALGVTLLAAVDWRKHRTAAAILALGCVVDFSAGVFLQVYEQSKENTGQEQVFGPFTFSNGQPGNAVLPHSLSSTAWSNWFVKHRYQISVERLQKLPQQFGSDPVFQQRWPAVQQYLMQNVTTDSAEWGGWWARNGGEVQYLGDHLAGDDGSGTDLLMGLFLLLGGGVCAAVWLQRSKARPERSRPERRSDSGSRGKRAKNRSAAQ